MERVLEPEVMDTAEDAEQYDAMDFLEANVRFADDALALVKGVQAPRVLDIGTGTARIPILMWQRAPSVHIVAIDLSTEMLRVAKQNIQDAGCSGSIELHRQDAKNLPIGADFDLIMCNSTTHHLPDPIILFHQINKLGAGGAAILVRDLFRPRSRELAQQIVDRAAAGDGPHQRQLFLDSLCAALTVEEVRQIAIEAGLADLHVGPISDRHWTAERNRQSAIPMRSGEPSDI